MDKTTLVYGDEKVVITCVYEGQSYSVDLLLNVEESSESGSDGGESGKSGCLVGALVGGGVGVVVVAAAVVVLLYLKKKKVK